MKKVTLFVEKKRTMEDVPKLWRMVLVGLAMVMLGGCATMTIPTQQELSSCDSGPYPDNYQSIVKDFMEQTLIDPMSAIYYFNEAPAKYGEKRKDQVVCGWMVTFEVNSKNRMGGYVGRTAYRLGIYHGRVTGGEYWKWKGWKENGFWCPIGY